jgi:SulP family sulfate permease
LNKPLAFEQKIAIKYMKNSNSKGMLLPDWLSGYQKGMWRADITAGLITAAVVIPKTMAYATVARLPVQMGLYTAFIPMIIYALIGSSRPLSVSTTTTIAILTAAQLNLVVPDADPVLQQRALVMLTLLVGAILVIASVLRLGFIANFISEPVLIGFKAGIGLVIVVDQIPKLLGIHLEKGGFFENILSIVAHIPETSLPTMIVGLIMVAILLGMQHFVPRAPAPLVAVGIGIVGMSLFNLDTLGVSVVGSIPRGLPSFQLPQLSLAVQLWPGALGIALMSFTESIAAGRAFLKSDEPLPGANRELFATGLANAGGAFLGSMPSGGGTSQTVVNRLAGARTQAAELITGGVTLVTMLFLAPLVSQMPNATLAAVVIVYSFGLIKPVEFRAILQIRRTEFIWALAALAGVVVLGTLQGIVLATIVSLIALAHQTADPPLHVLGRKPGTNVFRPITAEHPEDETFPGLLLLRLEGPVFFANAEVVRQKAQREIEKAKPRVVVIDCGALTDLEYTALKMCIEGERAWSKQGVEMWLVGLNPEVFAVIQRSSLGQTLGRERMHFNLEAAVATYQA